MKNPKKLNEYFCEKVPAKCHKCPAVAGFVLIPSLWPEGCGYRFLGVLQGILSKFQFLMPL